MSDSESEAPSRASVANAIRQVVISIHKAGNDDDLTVNRVRTGAEQKLGLSTGFLKSDAWKDESKTLIKEAVERYCGDDDAPEPSPKQPAKAKSAAKPASKKKSTDSAPHGVKRKAAATATKPRKRNKDVSSDEESEVAHIETEDSHRIVTTPPVDDNGADSDLSSVLDEPPIRKRKRNTEKRTEPAKATKPKPKSKSVKTEDDPDQAEIKRLQGWLVKCGIRKVWGKELAKCETPKDKIRHLKGMLKDAGMDGKFSVEKAARIKEQREFAKDLEEIQAGAAAWGETSTGRPRRAAAVARKPQPVVLSEDNDDDVEEKAQDAKADRTDDDDDDDDDDDNAVRSDSGSNNGSSGQDDDDVDEDSD